MASFELLRRFAGPRSMGHGGYVAGLVAEAILGEQAAGAGAVQITLRRPTPFDQPLELVGQGEGRVALVSGDIALVEGEPTKLELDPPPLPSTAAARAAEPGSPSFYGAEGVHPSCFGCSSVREVGDALRIFAGPCRVDEKDVVAASWTPSPPFVDDRGCVPTRYVVSAVDCPGGFAFIAAGKRAGLLGRIVFEQHQVVCADVEYRVVGWQIGEDGRKLFAGTALIDPHDQLAAVARATWFVPSAS